MTVLVTLTRTQTLAILLFDCIVLTWGSGITLWLTTGTLRGYVRDVHGRYAPGA